MGNETKIGIFVLVGVVLFGTAIFLLGDYSFKSFYQVDIEFNDVAGLPDKSMVKLSGVEVGKVKRIYMEDGGVIVQVSIFDGIKIYRDARFFIGSTSIIGSKYLQIDQGSRFAGIIKKGDRVKGENTLSLDRALTAAIADVRKIIGSFDGESIGANLNNSLANLREITANINQIVATSKPHAENIMVRLDSLTARLDDVMEKTNKIMTKIDNGEGTIGALMSDKTMKDDVAGAISNLKEATASAKDALGRIKGFRTYFEVGAKYEPLIYASKIKAGVKIYPRDGKYYYLGASNLINTKNIKRGTDYSKRNTVDALLGWEWGDIDFYAGALSGAGGAGIKYSPFHSVSVLDKLTFLFEASDISRNRYIKGRRFDSPIYTVGADYKVSKYISTGIKVEDLAETKRLNYNASIIFEDKDIAYLFGFASLASVTK